MAQGDELSPTRARQGSKGRPVLYVLIGGLALGAIFIIGFLAFGSSGNPPPSTGVVQDVQKSGAKNPQVGGGPGGSSKEPTTDPQVGRQTTEKPKSAQ